MLEKFMLAFILIASSPAATPNPNMDYYRCVQDHVKRWARTGEAATVIVNTSIVSCEEQKVAVKEWAKTRPNSTGVAVETWLQVAEKVAREDAYKTVLDAKAGD
jgi:hypothetical protein